MNHTQQATDPARKRLNTLIIVLICLFLLAGLMGVGAIVGIALYVGGKSSDAATRAQASSEIAQLSTACDAFHVQFGFYPPNNFDGDSPNARTILMRMYPRWNGTGYVSPGKLTGGQCLVYFLGGPNGTGWDVSGPTAPLNKGGAKHGPFYDFTSSRISNKYYNDPWGSPYKYIGYDVSTYSYPYSPVDGVSAYMKFGSFENVGKCQIISAGPDQKFGSGGNWYPGNGEYSRKGVGADDLANFNYGMPLGR